MRKRSRFNKNYNKNNIVHNELYEIQTPNQK